MNDWRKPCEHGNFDTHLYSVPCPRHVACGQTVKDECPGGSPVTAADLEGEKVWWCLQHEAIETAEEGTCEFAALSDALFEATRREGDIPDPGYTAPCDIVERLLIPIPDPQPATEGMFFHNEPERSPDDVEDWDR